MPGLVRLPGHLQAVGISSYQQSNGLSAARAFTMRHGILMAEESENNNSELPPRIKAVFEFLEHARDVTSQWQPSIPARELSKLEKNVETAALRALLQYLLGEMDFAEPPALPKHSNHDGQDGTTSPPAGSSK
jgi:hypothetical protein